MASSAARRNDTSNESRFFAKRVSSHFLLPWISERPSILPFAHPKESGMKAQTIARCGMLIALLSVSAWVTLPLGPIP